MRAPVDEIRSFLRTKQRTLASLIAAVMLFNGLLAVSRALEPAAPAELAGTPGLVGGTPEVIVSPDGTITHADGTVTLPDGTVIEPGAGLGAGGELGAGLPGTGSVGPEVGVRRPKTIGVTDDEILVVYYWKGERTMTSPFLGGTSQEGQNLDEGLAFERYIEFINKYADGGASFMGIPINLHGRKLRGVVIDAGNGDFSYAQAAEKIAREIKPFAAISSHGSLSAYICPRLSEAGIANLSTYDLGGIGGTLQQRTNGYCLPNGLTWERQIDLTIGYLKQHATTPYRGAGLPRDRVYGVVYATYPGLKDSAPLMIERLKKAGIPIAAEGKLPPDLANAQTHAPNVVAKMRNANVNTIIMPDAGAPLTFTHAAQANGYRPDYYVWPCSGQDTSGMVRLFNPAQWEGAQGLTCYDREFNPDLVNDNRARNSEWYKQYQEIAGSNREPPSPSPLVYSGLFQLVAGLSNAGPELTVESFRAGLDRVKRYRYSATAGRTDNRANMLISILDADRSWIGDAAKLRWDSTRRESGSSTQGAYVYPESRRYTRASQL